MATRTPAVAGRFYPGTKKELDNQLSDILQNEKSSINLSLSKMNILGGIVPHAGYMYSGYQAIHFFEILRNSKIEFDTFIIINPNHTGYGPEIALDGNTYWKTPYGLTEIDLTFYDLLGLPVSSEAHKHEHSGEVLLPMLQFSLKYPFRIVPITMFNQQRQIADELAMTIFIANQKAHKRICVIASSDFSHFVTPEEGRRLDGYVLDGITNFNSHKVYQEVREKSISVCGYGPIMTLIEYSKLVSNDPENQILKIGHSGEIHDSREVVDYISVLFYDQAIH